MLESITPDIAVATLEEAKRLLDRPHPIVRNYTEFVTDEAGETLEYGDPSACRFCVAGLLRHAYVIVTDDLDNSHFADDAIMAGPDRRWPAWGDGPLELFGDLWDDVHSGDDPLSDGEADRMRDMLVVRLDEKLEEWSAAR